MMQLPFFYKELLSEDKTATLNEDTSKHIVQVLRMKKGEQVQLTDGKGWKQLAEITTDNKKSVEVKIIKSEFTPPSQKSSTIAISLIKNAPRFEWFLEKAAEIGISEIIPLICDRTEKQHFRFERMKNILISAMLQSQQVWLPVLQPPLKFKDVLPYQTYEQKYIAHCMETDKVILKDILSRDKSNTIILIGPEGDFTPTEVSNAIENGYIPVTLGETRLRTETAGIAACIFLVSYN